jgi:hypothetical protein
MFVSTRVALVKIISCIETIINSNRDDRDREFDNVLVLETPCRSIFFLLKEFSNSFQKHTVGDFFRTLLFLTNYFLIIIYYLEFTAQVLQVLLIN